MSLGIKEFSDYVYEWLTATMPSLGVSADVILTNPNKTSTFPCREILTPLKSVSMTHALDIFQISISHWNESQRSAMEMTDETDNILLEHNLIRTNTSPCLYDEIIKKYHITTTYEVKYNAIDNAFQRIR